MGETQPQHWDRVYAGRAMESLSWYEDRPSTSIRLLSQAIAPSGAVVDVGAGASFLADVLLDAGWSDITVVDVSSTALALVRHRLADAGPRLWIVVADLLEWVPPRTYDAWHDRAVFHFLTDPEDRRRYVRSATGAVRPGGALVLGTFAADGPDRCSGLRTAGYDAAELAALFAPAFALEHAEREEHATPSGVVQPFTWVVLRRGDG